MKPNLRIFASILVCTLISAVSSLGQQKQTMPDYQVRGERERIEREQSAQGPERVPMPPPGNTFFFIESEINFDGKLVKGAPYSAQAVTETTQTLGDGNRIINKSSSTFYRDSEGRTRREMTINVIGPAATSNEPLQTIFINDPVAGVSYSLDSRTHSARKNQSFRVEAPAAGVISDGPGVKAERVPRGLAAGVGQEGQVFSLAVPPPGPGVVGQFVFKSQGPRPDNVVRQSLGKQLIEGVEVDGSRTTVTIPAGEIGNERPIEIVDERWYSADLQTVIMSRHSDPRSGETVYRLTNINRSEPLRSLFEVPSDYTLKEDTMRWRTTAKPSNEQ